MACQSVMSGMFKNMSLLNTKFPGLLPKVVCTPVRMACMAIDSASSMKSFALVTSQGGSSCSKVRKMLPTVWCICSQIALACGFLLDVGASLILQLWRRNWNSGPTNSPPLSCTQRAGQGYLANQVCAYFRATCADVFLSILISSTKLVTVSITVRALNTTVVRPSRDARTTQQSNFSCCQSKDDSNKRCWSRDDNNERTLVRRIARSDDDKGWLRRGMRDRATQQPTKDSSHREYASD